MWGVGWVVRDSIDFRSFYWISNIFFAVRILGVGCGVWGGSSGIPLAFGSFGWIPHIFFVFVVWQTTTYIYNIRHILNGQGYTRRGSLFAGRMVVSRLD